MIENNCYYKNALNSYIIFEKNTLEKLPDIFHLFIEIGLNVFESEINYKAKQINKYISIINLANEINNEKVKNIYKQQFQEYYNLNLNSQEKKEEEAFVYMIIGNTEYSNFTTRFLDKKI